MLVDLTKCVGCGWCQEACKQSNELPLEKIDNWSAEQDALPLSANTWTLVTFKDIEQNGEQVRLYAKRQCMHCQHPACVSACPVSALQKTACGAVVYDAARCIGCRYCMMACPFGIPKFEWNEPIPLIRKCTFCADRQEDGLEPACADACPTGALLFGDRAALIAEAEKRIQEHPDKYIDHIYGKDELGGTSWLYLSPISFEELGFPTLEAEPVTDLSETVATRGTPAVGLGVTFLLGALYYWFAKPRAGTGGHAED
jgi:formate dehydrogenase iron-sulfur subunit